MKPQKIKYVLCVQISREADAKKICCLLVVFESNILSVHINLERVTAFGLRLVERWLLKREYEEPKLDKVDSLTGVNAAAMLSS